MHTYSIRAAVTKTTGHYRRPGTMTTYCTGAPTDLHANTGKTHRICARCVKAEARDRAEAAAVANDHREGAAEQALAQSLTPKMRDVLPAVVAAGSFRDAGLTNLPQGVTDPSLQGLIRRGLAERYDTGETFVGFEGRIVKVWHYRATDLGRAVALAAEHGNPVANSDRATAPEQANTAEPLSLEDLTDTVICPTCHVAAGTRCVTRVGKPARAPHDRRFEAVEDAAGITQHRAAARREAEARGGWLICFDRKAEGDLLTAYADRLAGRAQLDDEQRLAAILVTEAEAAEGTWRGEWIGECTTATAPTLFPLDREQGALFA
ncbi:hypothetical protein [Streptomyces noursei]|uniref:zinc finger domain-containing protein n=1 Tax=Streptomyces noursei TaxID=1971 RepID=UPI0023B7793D|nr:hypothetical protein [Streptomyces noursei]